MILKGLILRADGVVAETDGLERAVLNHVVEAAGFGWRCSRETYQSLRAYPRRRDRYRQFARQNLGFDRSSDDFERLVEVMSRHAGTVTRERLVKDFLEPRPGIRELASAARGDGVRVAIVTALPKDEAHHLVSTLFGERGVRLFASICAPDSDDSEGGLQAAYAAALEDIGTDPANCLALEATPHGATCARLAGIPAVILVGNNEPDSCKDALFSIEEIPELIGRGEDNETSFLTTGDGRELLSALRQAQSGYFDVFGKLHRSYAMKVADILKDKGSAVKVITPSDTIRSLAQRLKADAVGAMVVIGPTGKIEGIISERDIANGLAVHGDALPHMMVADLMTTRVVTCAPHETIASVAKIMTQRRFRHMPVEEDGELVGVVSIGDVLKHRLDELQLETNVLRDFLLARG